MAKFDISVIMRLVDQITAPLREVVRTLNELQRQTAAVAKAVSFAPAIKRLQRLRDNVAGVMREMKRLEEGAARLRPALSAGPSGGWASAFVADLNQIRAAQRSVTQGQRELLSTMRTATASQITKPGGPLAPISGPSISVPSIPHPFAPVAPRGKGEQPHFPWMVPVPRPSDIVGSTLHASANLQDELTYMKLLGLDQLTQDDYVAEARRVVRIVPETDEASNLHRLRELRYALGDDLMPIKRGEDGSSILEQVSKAFVVMKAAAGGGEHGQRLVDQTMEMVKSAELRNEVHNPKEFLDFLNSLTKTAISSSGLVQPRQVFGAYKYARTALHGYNDEFIAKFMPELIQELMTGRNGLGSSAGTGLESWKRAVVDGIMKPEALKEWGELGLLSAKGEIKGRDVATQNPLAFTTDTLFPALRKRAVAEGLQFNAEGYAEDHRAWAQFVTKQVGKLFSNRTAGQIETIMLIQLEQMQKRGRFWDQASGLLDAYSLGLDNYNRSVDRFDAQIRRLKTRFGGPLLDFLANIRDFATNVINRVADVFEAAPKASWLALGGLAAGAVTGIRMILRHFGGMRNVLLGAAGAYAVSGSLTGLVLGGMLGRLAGVGASPAGEAAKGGLMRRLFGLAPAVAPAATAAAGAATAVAAARWSWRTMFPSLSALVPARGGFLRNLWSYGTPSGLAGIEQAGRVGRFMRYGAMMAAPQSLIVGGMASIPGLNVILNGGGLLLRLAGILTPFGTAIATLLTVISEIVSGGEGLKAAFAGLKAVFDFIRGWTDTILGKTKAEKDGQSTQDQRQADKSSSSKEGDSPNAPETEGPAVRLFDDWPRQMMVLPSLSKRPQEAPAPTVPGAAAAGPPSTQQSNTIQIAPHLAISVNLTTQIQQIAETAGEKVRAAVQSALGAVHNGALTDAPN